MGLRSWWPLLLGAPLGVGAAVAIPSLFELAARSEEDLRAVPLPSRVKRPPGPADAGVTSAPVRAVKGPEPTNVEEEIAARFAHPALRKAMWLYFTGDLPAALTALEAVRADRSAFEHHLLADALLADVERIVELERKARQDLSRHSPYEAADKLRLALSIDTRLTEPARIIELERAAQVKLRERMTSAQRKTLISLYVQYTRDRGKLLLKNESMSACGSWRLGLDFVPDEPELTALIRKECVPRALAAIKAATFCNEVSGPDAYSTHDAQVDAQREQARRRLCRTP
jgi:hypothetical protein